MEEAVVVPRTTTGTTSREEGRAAAKREQDKQDKDRYREDGAGEKAADELRLDDQPRRKALADAETFEGIAARSMQTAAEARQQRRVWRAFADAHRHDPQADEARVRAVEAAALAYRLSGEPADWQTLENDVRAYLKRSDAQQKERVRQLAPASRP